MAVLVLAAVAVWLLPREGLDRPEGAGVGGLTPTEPVGGRPVATMGTGRTTERIDELSTGVTTPAIIRELQTITGLNDARETIGRRVELHLPVQEVASHVAFWVGAPENRMLVVLERDTRDGVARQRGEPPAHAIAPAQEGERVAIEGTVQDLPEAEAMFSWGLTRPEHAEVVDRGVYIRADALQAAGVR